MKSTKKIIIGVIALVALLITIAGALAAPVGSFDPNNNAVTVLKNATQDFKYTITNNDIGNLTYTWVVDDVVKNTETKADQNYTSTYLMNGNDFSLGTHTVSVTVFGSSDFYLVHTWTITVQEPQPESVLSITKVKVNGKTSGDLTPSGVNEIEVEIANDHTEDLEDIKVTVRILDVDGDDLEEEADISKIRDGDDDTVSVEFDLSKENLDEDDYVIEVEVEGEDDDGNDYVDSESFNVKVDRENDDIIITRVDLQNSQVLCSLPQTSLDVQIKNVGENDQDGAKITVKNSALGVDLQKANLNLDDYAGSDNDHEATFALNLEDAKEGTYLLDIAVYSEDNDLMDSEEIELQVSCPDGTSAQKKQQEQGQYADQELAAELQKKIDEYRTLQEAQAAKGNLRESSSYVLLLGVLVALMFFAAVLSATYLLVKRK